MPSSSLVLERCPIVLAGHWNRAIFSPQWVLAKVFPGVEKLELGMLFGELPVLTFQAQDVSIHLLPGHIRIYPVGGLQSLSTAEVTACRILSHLPETPVRAVGFNFGFDVVKPSEQVQHLFDLRDVGMLSEPGPLVQSEISHSVQYGADGQMTVDLVKSKSPEFRIDLNFHWSTENAGVAEARIQGRIQQALQDSFDVIGRVYGLECKA